MIGVSPRGRRRLLLAALSLAQTGTLGAQGASSKVNYDIKPTVLDSKNASSSTVGIDYSISQEFPLKTMGSGPSLGFDDINASVKQLAWSYSSKGTVAAVPDRNPRNFIEFEGAMKFLLSTAAAGTYRVGVAAKFETNQAGSATQTVLGGGATWGKLGLLRRTDFVALDVNYGRVDPKGDTARARVLGSSPPSAYGRINFESLYLLPLKIGPATGIELNARIFWEPSAPAAVQREGLDVKHLITGRITLKDEMFVAYSTGQLPLDRRRDQVLAIGWSYKVNGVKN